MTSATKFYRETVEKLAANATNQRITNSGPEHAEIVLESMLRNAKSVVRLYSGSLRDVYKRQSLIEAAQGFLSSPDSNLKILLEKETEQDGQAFLAALPKGRVAIKIAKKKVSPNHFSVADDRAYRIELDDSAVQALVNFNEPDIAVVLSNMFDQAFDQAEVVKN